MRSTLRTIVFSVAAFAIPVGGAFTLREGLIWLPEALWAAALPAAMLAGMRWRLVGVAAAAGMGALLMALIYGPASLAFHVTPLTLELWMLMAAWTVLALVVGALGMWVGARWRSGSLLQALTDSATGLPNRRRAELYLEHEFAVAELGRPLAVLLLDVDGFTAYSATNGEAAASGVLRALGTILRQNTRSANLSAHWQEDRFACLLLGASDEGAFKYARMLQDDIRASADVASLPSVSIGIACYDRDMSSPSDLLRATEHALLQAKKDGGNRIRFHGRALEDLELATGDSGPVRRKSGRQKHAAPEAGGSVRDPVTGAPRTAFVFSTDAGMRHRAVEQLERRGMRVTEGSRASETMRPLGREFDLVVVELTRDDPGVRDLVHEVRRRHPAARIVGIPGFDGKTISASAFAVHVDGHLLHTGGRWIFQPPLEELLRERDQMRGTAMRALQLSDEVRAKEKEARTAQQEGEERLQSVVQSIREVLFRVDRSGAWISLSPAWSAIAGHPVESSLGRPWLEFFHEDDRAALSAEFDSLSSIERPVVRREARIVTRSGGVRWVEIRAHVVHDRFGSAQSASGTMADITERRRAEEALRRNEEYFRSLIENGADVIMVMDAEGQVRYISPSVERVLGLGVSGALAAIPGLDELCHTDDLPALRAALHSAETPGSSASLEMRARHADGSWRSLAASIRNLTHIPAVRGFVVNAHDVTGHREAERALRESEEALFRARKMDAIGVLAGGIANDFNNLLTAIRGHADIALSALAPDHPIRIELGRIQESAARAAALTRQLLAFGRRQVLRPKSVDLNVFVSDLHKMLVRIIGDQIQVHTELSASPARVQADPMQIERVILNLAINAREAMPRGGVFSIRTRWAYVNEEEARSDDMEPGGYVVLSLSDTGHGIPQEIQAHVFDPFFSTKPQAVGVGLGLSTVYGIVRQTGGHVRVDSRTGDDSESTGTTFTLWLPAAGQGADSVNGPTESDPDRTGETIALVEDETAVRDLAERILRGRGYNVIAAEDGLQAMDLLARYPHRIDMLVTDVVMPGMGGRDLADRIGTMRPGLKILFISGYSTEAVEQHGVLARGTTFLEKPFSPDTLLRRVRDMLDERFNADSAETVLAGPGHPPSEVDAGNPVSVEG